MMQLVLVIACVLAGVFAPTSTRADAGSLSAANRFGQLEIRVDDTGWGSVSSRDIESVLHSVADILVPRSSIRSPLRIRVSHTDGCPLLLYDRGPAGEYRMLLHAGRGARWHLYAYEFAHEFCHILSNYDSAGPDVARRNQWFEEALCEAASLHVLDRLGEQWRAASAGPVAAKHAADLRAFRQKLDADNRLPFPEAGRIDAWLREQQADLRADPYQRDKNDLLARAILPLFLDEPDAWSSLEYMNLHTGDPLASLEEFFRNWHAAAPARHRHFIARLSRLLAGEAGIPDQPATAAAERYTTSER